jgi:hypothetical protein
MECVARASVMATSGGTGALGFFVHHRNRTVYGFTTFPRRCRSHKSMASSRVPASTRRFAFATLSARASLLRSASGPACGHRRLTTQSSGRRPAASEQAQAFVAGAAYFER